MDYLADTRKCPDTAAAIFKDILIQKAGGNCFKQVKGNNTDSANKRDTHRAFRQQKLNDVIYNACTHICNDQPDVHSAPAIAQDLLVHPCCNPGRKHADSTDDKLQSNDHQSWAHFDTWSQIKENKH